ncbi:MAG: hypothetical protein J6X14_00925 [Lachnospiraceae bacterium]|nr:hypothetical protein [Lachnospiraceae bacterium]
MAFYQGYQYQQPYVYPQNYAQMQQPVQQTQNTPQIQNGGFVSVRSEADARNYPVAPGNSVTFKDENAPYIYTKTMGFSQLDRPLFEKYRLEKEEVAQVAYEAQTGAVNLSANILSEYVKKAEFEDITARIEAIQMDVDRIKRRVKDNDQSDADSANVAND